MWPETRFQNCYQTLKSQGRWNVRGGRQRHPQRETNRRRISDNYRDANTHFLHLRQTCYRKGNPLGRDIEVWIFYQQWLCSKCYQIVTVRLWAATVRSTVFLSNRILRGQAVKLKGKCSLDVLLLILLLLWGRKRYAIRLWERIVTKLPRTMSRSALEYVFVPPENGEPVINEKVKMCCQAVHYCILSSSGYRVHTYYSSLGKRAWKKNFEQNHWTGLCI